MAIRLHCRACGKRLKLPDQVSHGRSARCPKCLAVVDLTPALEAATYATTTALPLPHASSPSATPAPARPVATTPPRLIGEDDPLPYLPTSASTAPTPAPTQQEPLSLDDDPEPADLPPEVAPFRAPVRVLADSLRQIAGPCFAVLVPHGLFLEHEPMRPFLYVPIGGRVDSPASGDLTITLPDRRAVTLRFEGRSGRALAHDVHGFLSGTRPAPIATDYRCKWWMLWPAMIFALGLASGPIVLSQTAELGLGFGLKVGAGFALVGWLVNIAVVLFSRRSVFVQMLTMAALCLLVTGVFLFGATAYLAGRQKAVEVQKPETLPTPPATNVPTAPRSGPTRPDRPPSHLELAKKNGSSTLPESVAAVTALELAPDGNVLGIGYADGAVHLCPLDQPTFEAMQPGPRADGAVLRIQFDRQGTFVFAHTATGVFAAPRTGPPPVVARIPGSPVAIVTDATERIRFAAVRDNVIRHRLLDADFVRNPPIGKGKKEDYALPNPKRDEIIPREHVRDPAKPADLTFLAWGPVGRLFAGQPGGSISIWSAAMQAEPTNHDHKATVKVWAACLATGGFATGDEKGNLALWPLGGGRPTLESVFEGAPITQLAFNPDGSRLAITDDTGRLIIWDTAASKPIHRAKRPTPIKALAYGPGSNVLTIASGHTAEVWWLPQLLK